MLGKQLAMQMQYGPQAKRLRAWGLGAIGLLALVWAIRNPQTPAQCVAMVAWTQFLLAVVVGGSLTGWRVTQMPKTRSAEFFLVTPRSDWEIVRAEVLSGLLRTAFVVGAGTPVIFAMWGVGWMQMSEAVSLAVIPTLCGWTAGLSLAAVAYAPLWFRRLIERLVLVAILAYLIVVGLFMKYFLMEGLRWWTSWTEQSPTVFGSFSRMLDYFNPFRLLGVLGSQSEGVELRLLATVGLLGGICLFDYWFLGWRLRRHYLEENFGNQYRKKKYEKPIGQNPLAWWTARRVSRFRGAVNLYLAWTTIGLYCGWMLLGDNWPDWAGDFLMRFFYMVGGSAIMGVFAVQFGLVPVGFLTGLWDSNQQQRVGRLELLLVTDLEPKEYLWGSVAASWTRGKWYAGAALFLWVCTAIAGRMSWWAALFVILCAANYALLFFAIAFRNFARIGNDRVSANLGLLMTVGIPFAIWGLFLVGLDQVAAATPLGGMFVVARHEELVAMGHAVNVAVEYHTQLPVTGVWVLVGLSNLVYCGISVWLIRTALARFDEEIHGWFADHLVSEEARRATEKEQVEAEAAKETQVQEELSLIQSS